MVASDMYNGETYDSRLEDLSWATSGGKSSVIQFAAAVVVAAPSAEVQVTSHSILPEIGVRDPIACF